MNLRYEIKKCAGYGYATAISECKMKQITRNKDKQIVYIKDNKNDGRIKNAINVGEDDFTFNDLFDKTMALNCHDAEFDKETVFLVEIGVYDTQIAHHDIEIPTEELEKTIDEFEIDADISDENKEAYRGFTKNLITNPKNYVNLECTEAYLDFLSKLYLKIDDSKLQRTILQLLVFNQKRCDELIKKHPITFKPVEEKIVRLASTFSDMKVSDPYFDKDEDQFDAEQINGVSRNLTVANISKFGSFSNKFAQVEHAKKRVNLPLINRLRNHQNLDILTRGRIASVPLSFQEFNISKLMRLMSRYNKFHVIFIYPNAHQPFIYNEYPTRAMEVDPENGCVVLAVVQRYMLINFFGMHAIVNEEDKFSKYMM